MSCKPVISIIFPMNKKVHSEVFKPSCSNLFTNSVSFLSKFNKHTFVKGDRVLCETIKNNQWYGHRIDFLLEKEDKEIWQPYIVEYDISRESPLPYRYNFEDDISRYLLNSQIRPTKII
jgi:hypothetical protein